MHHKRTVSMHKWSIYLGHITITATELQRTPAMGTFPSHASGIRSVITSDLGARKSRKPWAEPAHPASQPAPQLSSLKRGGSLGPAACYSTSGHTISSSQM